ncbi:DUF4166 domain-containing protein [Arthrobacter jiangjiafuii]|uniref:DUF4166 domain-containing protein n=1 Tax=Arthrobacter jiangjiafuii TaxID=2817475 RepID=A0A975R1N5_9MICC|nr:DUF4166 domain-containing protein [Arthrobacter jiangjiafuii]MBP3045017.1 DUF4166 domain-containing protein [Arthrobacter jiangjiafuii]QWC10654.1 DUF4166 domain-containing protein [Arthrobacter jiangjiafuii]
MSTASAARNQTGAPAQPAQPATTSESVFRQALGDDFDRLHPMLQRRFGVDPGAGYACVGNGVFAEVRRGAWWTVPFLKFGAFRNILFPDQGTNVPFTIENYPYIDRFGRPTVTFIRTLDIRPGRRRRFDATMIYSPGRGAVVDYLGTHQHLATDLQLAVREDGSLHLRSTALRFHEGPLSFTVPGFLTGSADLYEAFDDARQVFTIQLQVRNPLFGFLFGYRGEFTCDFPAVTGDDVPFHLKPVREEFRD